MKITVIGTGMIGTAIAKAMIHAGNKVYVYNRTISKTEELVGLGATAVTTVKEGIERADATIIAVYGGDILNEVLLNDEVKPVLKGKKLLTVATSEAEEIKKTAREIASASGSFSELAIQSGVAEVVAKQAYGLLGCEESSKDFWIEVMSAIGEIVYVGEVGTPANAVIPSILGAGLMSLNMAYGVAYAIKNKLPQEVVTKDIAMFMPGSEQMIAAMFNRDYSQGVASLNGYRDTIDMAVKALKQAGLPTTVFDDIIALYHQASDRGYGEEAESALIEALLD